MYRGSLAVFDYESGVEISGPRTVLVRRNTGYAPASGEILGILRQLQEDMEATLSDITKVRARVFRSF